MKTMECEKCGKTIQRIGGRKYCTSCRIAIDKEFAKAYADKHRVTEKKPKSKGWTRDCW